MCVLAQTAPLTLADKEAASKSEFTLDPDASRSEFSLHKPPRMSGDYRAPRLSYSQPAQYSTDSFDDHERLAMADPAAHRPPSAARGAYYRAY